MNVAVFLDNKSPAEIQITKRLSSFREQRAPASVKIWRHVGGQVPPEIDEGKAFVLWTTRRSCVMPDTI